MGSEWEWFCETELHWRWWELCLAVSLGDDDEWLVNVGLGPFMLTAGWRNVCALAPLDVCSESFGAYTSFRCTEGLSAAPTTEGPRDGE